LHWFANRKMRYQVSHGPSRVRSMSRALCRCQGARGPSPGNRMLRKLWRTSGKGSFALPSRGLS